MFRFPPDGRIAQPLPTDGKSTRRNAEHLRTSHEHERSMQDFTPRILAPGWRQAIRSKLLELRTREDGMQFGSKGAVRIRRKRCRDSRFSANGRANLLVIYYHTVGTRPRRPMPRPIFRPRLHRRPVPAAVIDAWARKWTRNCLANRSKNNEKSTDLEQKVRSCLQNPKNWRARIGGRRGAGPATPLWRNAPACGSV